MMKILINHINKLFELLKIVFLRVFRMPIGWIINIEKIPDPTLPPVPREENIIEVFPEDRRKREKISETNPRMLFSHPTDWGVEFLNMIEEGKMHIGDTINISIKNYVEYHMAHDPNANPEKFKKGIVNRDISRWLHLRKYSFSESRYFDNAGTEYSVIKRLT